MLESFIVFGSKIMSAFFILVMLLFIFFTVIAIVISFIEHVKESNRRTLRKIDYPHYIFRRYSEEIGE